MISSCCSFVLSPGLVGQSMLFTVATQAARNSRVGGGGSFDEALRASRGMRSWAVDFCPEQAVKISARQGMRQ